MIRFPTHDGRGGFTRAISSRHSEKDSAIGSQYTAVPSLPALVTPSTKALSTHASTSSSILDDALPRQTHPSTDLSQRIHAWAQEQQLYARLRHKRRRLSSLDAEMRVSRNGIEGWIWRFVSSLIGMDDDLLQIVLGEKRIETETPTKSEGRSFWEGFLRQVSHEKHLSAPFPSPHFQQIFRQQYQYSESAASQTPVSPSRPARPAPSPWDAPRHRGPALPKPQSSWSSVPPDPIQTAPFQPSPIHLTSSHTDHAAWGIEDNDILSTSTEVADDYWDRELTLPLVWHLFKSFITTRLPLQQSQEKTRSCKAESVTRWDDGDERAFYWHESIDGASSAGLGLGGMGAWAEV